MKPKRLHVRLMLIGVASGVLIVLATGLYSSHLTTQIEALRRECQPNPYAGALDHLIPAENRLDRTAPKLSLSPWNAHKGVCEPYQLRRLIRGNKLLAQFPPPGAQGQLLEVAMKQDTLRGWSNSIWGFAAAVAGVMSLPFLWYFILARVSEISGAIRGRE